MSLSSIKKNCDDSLTSGDDHDPHFDPIISLPEVKTTTMEEDEIVLIQLRAKLFRHDTVEKEWKERGTGDVKLLHNYKLNTVRIVMRRDKTFKLCANHFVTHEMKLNPSCGSDRAWVWTTMADASDDIPKVEILAIKFMNTEAAKKWKDKFEEAKSLIGNSSKKNEGNSEKDEEKQDENEVSNASENEQEEEEEEDENVNCSNNFVEEEVINKVAELKLKEQDLNKQETN